MSNLDAILEVSIGLVFVWLILSAATMEAQNVIARIFQTRAKFLEKMILDMFQGHQEYVDTFYEKPAIQALYRKGFLGRNKRPDYIPDQLFGEVAFEMLIDLGLGDDAKNKDNVSVQDVMRTIDALNNPRLSQAISKILPNLGGEEILSKAKNFEANAKEVKDGAEKWFDTSMKRAFYWYKEQAQMIAFILGLTIAIVLNIDTVAVAQQLWRDPTLRQALVAQAQTTEIDGEPISISDMKDEYESINLPIGWVTEPATGISSCSGISWYENNLIVQKEGACYEVTNIPASNNFWGWLTKAIGLLLSAAAAMQGAPFWFAMLKDLLDLKDTMKKDKKETGDTSTTAEPQAVG